MSRDSFVTETILLLGGHLRSPKRWQWVVKISDPALAALPAPTQLCQTRPIHKATTAIRMSIIRRLIWLTQMDIIPYVRKLAQCVQMGHTMMVFRRLTHVQGRLWWRTVILPG